MNNKMNKIKNNQGFSLIELMVATSIFVVIMLSAMGALFSLLDGSKNSRALRISMDNINFAMESMTRSLRMGYDYHCTDSSNLSFIMQSLESVEDCNAGNDAIAFLPKRGDFVKFGYKLEEDSLFKCEGPNSCFSMVSPDVKVTDLKFYVFGSEDPEKQPGVYIIIKGQVKVKDDNIPFSLQTMVSARNF
jgi:prepilin-type N-terminal cleavage/methylation domain-containing protein